ncbi:uncharacterized protein LOC133731220 [Rosa rugosa]|uniref:uncharacterized protein LOC133731220 n=1 Tax=Rosa rugosa TaxID=74645 RepID=UPI002B4052B5|nr:uncharacterized protein LOC133731220 [Rosa rugosa]
MPKPLIAEIYVFCSAGFCYLLQFVSKKMSFLLKSDSEYRLEAQGTDRVEAPLWPNGKYKPLKKLRLAEVEAEQKELQEAIKNARQRGLNFTALNGDCAYHSLKFVLQQMSLGKLMKTTIEKEHKVDKVGDLALSASLEEHAEASQATRDDNGDSDGDDEEEDGEGVRN